MNIGDSMREMRNRKGYSQSNIADDLFVDQTMISKIELNQRTATKELASASVGLSDDAKYGFEIAREVASDYITPLVTAEKAIELHRLALEEVFKREAIQAVDKFNEVSLVKPPEYVDETEKEHIAQGMGELLDVQAVINSFLMRLEQEYDISIKVCMKNRVPNWKSRGWIE